jgi:hypothetical protein
MAYFSKLSLGGVQKTVGNSIFKNRVERSCDYSKAGHSRKGAS